MRLRLLLPLCALLLTLGACDDVPGIGSGQVSEPGGEPQGRRVLVDSVNTTRTRDFTGGSAGSATSTPQNVLAGRVVDPSLGTVEARAAVEFGNPTGNNLTGFRGTAVTKATLTVPLARYYGDTTSAVTYELRSLAKELTTIGIPSDSALATSSVVTTVTANRRDSVLTVVLPAAWITANDARLRATAAGDSLHGFVLAALSGNQVRRIRFSGVVLTAIAGADTARFTGSIGATQVTRTGVPALAASERLLQDGFPARLTVPFDTSGLGSGGALARVSLVVPYDSTRLVTPAGFLRPAPPRLQLLGLNAAGTTLLFNGLLFGQALPTKGRAIFTSEPLRRAFQDAKSGRSSPVTRLTFTYDDLDGGLGAMVVNAEGPSRPYFVFTTVGN